MEFIFLNSSNLLENLAMLRNDLLTRKLLKQGYRYHKLCKTFSKFYHRYYDSNSKFNIGLNPDSNDMLRAQCRRSTFASLAQLWQSRSAHRNFAREINVGPT